MLEKKGYLKRNTGGSRSFTLISPGCGVDLAGYSRRRMCRPVSAGGRHGPGRDAPATSGGYLGVEYQPVAIAQARRTEAAIFLEVKRE